MGQAHHGQSVQPARPLCRHDGRCRRSSVEPGPGGRLRIGSHPVAQGGFPDNASVMDMATLVCFLGVELNVVLMIFN